MLASAGQATADEGEPLDPFFGVVSQRTVAPHEFDKMRDARLGSFRLPIDWSAVEPEADGVMDFDLVDIDVRATAERGIRFMPTLYGSPRSMNRNWRVLPVRNGYQVRKWRQFVAAAVSRYGAGGTFWEENPEVPYRPVREWQIWNEPNIDSFAKPVSARLYAKLLRVSAARIRQVDPTARIVTGGLYGKPPPGHGPSAARFLDRLYRFRGTRRAFDILAVHPYARNAVASLRRTARVRKVLNRHGNRGRRMSITELGWGSDDLTGFGLGTTDAQAYELGLAYSMYLDRRRWLRLNSIYWFSWSDMPPESGTCAFCFNTGILDVRGDPKPAWHEMLTFTKGS